MNMLKKFIEDRDIENSTIKGYTTVINQYTSFHNAKIEDLINEAWEDEENYHQMYKRKIYDRLNDFRTALIKTEELESTTINSKISKLSTFYSHFGVEIPKINSLKDKRPQITYFDLPNKKHINEALEFTGIQNQALILFLASSGTGKSECANITIQDFIDATEEYHSGGDLNNILNELFKVKNDLVPTFRLRRVKTNKQYYTFCTPESSFAIIRYLKQRIMSCNNKNVVLKLDEPLFGLSKRNIGDRLAYINDSLGFGFKDKYRFFRAHSLRKFHASNIGLSEEHVNMLQGRSRDTIQETYIKSNPHWLKEIYMNAMDNVTINLEKQRNVINEEYNININVHIYESDLGISL